MAEEPEKQTRRQFLVGGVRAAGLLACTGLAGAWLGHGAAEDYVWQLDPDKCVQCDRCGTHCVLNPSAVKCVHEFKLCGYCRLCFGFFDDQRSGDTDGAENQRCPTGAIRRSFVEDPYYEPQINEALCIGCGKCVKGCTTYGTGALGLQVRHDRCLNCNQCRIATYCPAHAFVRVPASRPYLLRTQRQVS